MTSAFISCSAFLKAHRFVEYASHQFYHVEAGLWIYYLPNAMKSVDEAIAFREKVLAKRKEGATVFVIRQSVWEMRLTLIQTLIQAKLQKLIAVFARDLRVEIVSEDIAKEFLSRHHLLGFTKGKWYVALFVPPHRMYRFSRNPEILQANNGLLAIAIFGKTIKRNKPGVEGMRSLEWIRLATLPTIRLVGGISKLFDFMFDQEPFDDMMTYVDIETNDARGLMGFGFQVEEMMDPMELTTGFNLGNYKLRYVR